jgi:hypothetical protein
MAKIYTVSADSTYVPTHFGGGRAARKIDTVPNPLNQEGLALTLNAEFVKHAVCVPSAGHEAQIAFSALHALKKFRTRTTRGQSLASVQGTGER